MVLRALRDPHVDRRAARSSDRRTRTGRGSRRRARCSMRPRSGLSVLNIPFSPDAGPVHPLGLPGAAGDRRLLRLRPRSRSVAGRSDQRHAARSSSRSTSSSRARACPSARPRAGVARLRGLARQLRPGAARVVQSGDGAVRAVVVGSFAALAAAPPPLGPPPRRRARRLVLIAAALASARDCGLGLRGSCEEVSRAWFSGDRRGG